MSDYQPTMSDSGWDLTAPPETCGVPDCPHHAGMAATATCGHGCPHHGGAS